MSQIHPLVSKAITHIIWSVEFFASLVPKLEFKQMSEHQMEVFRAAGITPTLATDYKRIMYNKEFIESMPMHQVAGCIVHEVLHCAMLHNSRRGSRDPRLWNIAGDYAINLIIDQIPEVALPTGGLLDDQYEGMTAEVIYDKLLDEGGNDKIKVFALEGDLLEPDGSDGGGETAMEEQEWKAAAAHAINAAKKAGNLPGGLETIFEPLLKPKLPWRQITENFLNRPQPGNRSWNRLNKRYLPRGIKFPTTKVEMTGDFVMACDTSGSMSDRMVQVVIDQVAYVISIIKPRSCTLIQHDAVVTKVDKFEHDDEFPRGIEIAGRGGTDFRPVFEYIDENIEETPSAVIMLTDGYGPWPEDEPDYPVLWILVDSPELETEVPYGEVALIDSHSE